MWSLEFPWDFLSKFFRTVVNLYTRVWVTVWTSRKKYIFHIKCQGHKISVTMFYYKKNLRNIGDWPDIVNAFYCKSGKTVNMCKGLCLLFSHFPAEVHYMCTKRYLSGLFPFLICSTSLALWQKLLTDSQFTTILTYIHQMCQWLRTQSSLFIHIFIFSFDS